MIITTTHNVLDFDALASMVAAGKLYPGCLKVYSGLIPPGVRRFTSIYKETLDLRSVKTLNLEQVKLAVVVDTANPRRLPLLEDLWKRHDLTIHIYDHHDRQAHNLQGELEIIEPVGAAVTLLLERIMEEKIPLNALEATIMALGIYDDTGGFIFPSTTPRDMRAAAFLLENGANLEIVEQFIERPFSYEQRMLLQEYMSNIERLDIQGVEVVLAQAELPEVLAGLDMVMHQLIELESGEVFFTLTKMGKRAEIIARSKTENANVAQILTAFKGFGHSQSAAAAIKEDIPLAELRERLLEELRKQVKPSLKTRDIMSFPVKSISETMNLGEAEKIMLRYGHTGMPVVNGDQVIGMISRRDVDKARMHKLIHAPVKGFMNTNVISVEPELSVREAQELMVRHDIGRLPVIEEGKLIGIISRSDILRTLHGKDYQDDHELLYVSSQTGKQNYDQLLRDYLDEEIYEVLRLAGHIAHENHDRVYLVGGMVRDLLLTHVNLDLDLVVEGSSRAFLEKFGRRLGVKARFNERFGTGQVILSRGLEIDVATARAEYYEFPAALPQVQGSSLREDLYRRDFTINTLALSLNPESFGDITDFFGAREDLEKKLVRILHNFSFVEDPTRVIRAIRFAARYNFTLEEHTRRLLIDAVKGGMLKRLSPKRIWHEVQLILQEAQPLKALYMFSEYNIWDNLSSLIDARKIAWDKFKDIEKLIDWGKQQGFKGIQTWWLGLFILLAAAESEGVEELLENASLSKRLKKAINQTRNIQKWLETSRPTVDIQNSAIWQELGEILPESALFMILWASEPELKVRLQKYVEDKKNTELATNGHTLKMKGLKAGPVFAEILHELYKMKLDHQLVTIADEEEQLQQWLAEGRI